MKTRLLNSCRNAAASLPRKPRLETTTHSSTPPSASHNCFENFDGRVFQSLTRIAYRCPLCRAPGSLSRTTLQLPNNMNVRMGRTDGCSSIMPSIIPFFVIVATQEPFTTAVKDRSRAAHRRAAAADSDICSVSPYITVSAVSQLSAATCYTTSPYVGSSTTLPSCINRSYSLTVIHRLLRSSVDVVHHLAVPAAPRIQGRAALPHIFSVAIAVPPRLRPFAVSYPYLR
ncbi:unnamed protein product [Phytophthora fragariaefolia]|uniref:Unnamed protein product n=1 Tax=Phytophthora fragariaefolia TaxID=1490495 RepID=A0A9W6X7E4_9STRA|nr:unnamed protein product [Phytophthora fragariaefolia]